MPDIRNKNRKVRQEALRQELQAKEYLRQIDLIDKAIPLDGGTFSTEQISALKLKADLQFKRLAKVLPDLKQSDVDINASVTHEHRAISNAAERIEELLRGRTDIATKTPLPH